MQISALDEICLRKLINTDDADLYTVTHTWLREWIALLRLSDVEKKRRKKDSAPGYGPCKVLPAELGRKYSFHAFESGDGRERQINRTGEVTRGRM